MTSSVERDSPPSTRDWTWEVKENNPGLGLMFLMCQNEANKPTFGLRK